MVLDVIKDLKLLLFSRNSKAKENEAVNFLCKYQTDDFREKHKVTTLLEGTFISYKMSASFDISWKTTEYSKICPKIYLFWDISLKDILLMIH